MSTRTIQPVSGPACTLESGAWDLSAHLDDGQPVLVIWDTTDAKTVTQHPNLADAVYEIEHDAFQWNCNEGEDEWDPAEWAHDDCGNPTASYGDGMVEATITRFVG